MIPLNLTRWHTGKAYCDYFLNEKKLGVEKIATVVRKEGSQWRAYDLTATQPYPEIASGIDRFEVMAKVEEYFRAKETA